MCMFCLTDNHAAQDAELERLHELFGSVGSLQQPEQDISAAQWLRQQGASERMLAGMLLLCPSDHLLATCLSSHPWLMLFILAAVAEACYANDFGCSLEQLGLGEMITENQRWDSGAP